MIKSSLGLVKYFYLNDFYYIVSKKKKKIHESL